MDHGVSGDLIVTDGNTEVTRFKEVIEDDSIKRIVVNVSGGTDSPLVIYFLAKFISQTKKYDKEIFPHFMVDTGNMLTIAPTLVPKQIDVIRGLFPDVTIHDVYTQDFLRKEDWHDDLERYIPVSKEGRHFRSDLYDDVESASLDGIKNLYCEPLKKNMWEVLKPDVLLNGKTSNLPNNTLKLYGADVSQPKARAAIPAAAAWVALAWEAEQMALLRPLAAVRPLPRAPLQCAKDPPLQLRHAATSFSAYAPALRSHQRNRPPLGKARFVRGLP